jgi:hypothetical protein
MPLWLQRKMKPLAIRDAPSVIHGLRDGIRIPSGTKTHNITLLEPRE